MSGNPCGCDPDARHLCDRHKIEGLEFMLAQCQATNRAISAELTQLAIERNALKGQVTKS